MNIAKAKAKSIRTSPSKLGLVLKQISGLEVGQALMQLKFSKRGIAPEVAKVLNAAISNAENNHNMDVDRLYVKEAYCGKSMMMKRFRARARGRAGRIHKLFSNMTIVVSEKQEV